MLVSHQKHSQIIDVVRIRGLALEVSDLVLYSLDLHLRVEHIMVWFGTACDMRRCVDGFYNCERIEIKRSMKM
jgi:hypothetical protein